MDHEETLTSVHNLGLLLQKQGKLNQAEPLLRRNLEVSERVLGVEHKDTINIRGNLGILLMKREDQSGRAMVRVASHHHTL